MMEAMNNVDSIDMDMTMKMDIDMAEFGTISTVTTGNMKQVIRSETDIDMLINMSTTMSGEGIPEETIPMTIYFTNGIMYTEMEMFGEAFRYGMAMSLEEAMEASMGIEMLDFAEDAIKDFNISTQGGNRKIEFTLDGGALNSLIEQVSSSLVGMGIDPSDMSIDMGDVINEIEINSDGMLVSYRMIADINMTMEMYGETISMNMSMDSYMTVNSYNDVVINFPADLDEWEIIDMF